MKRALAKYIAQAEEAWEEGYRVTATVLNQLLAVVAPTQRVTTEAPTHRWSLELCRTRLLDNLRPIRTELPEPIEDDKDVIPWTVGNLGATRRRLVATSAELAEVIDSHKKLKWAAEEWRRELAVPVHEHAAEWREWFRRLREYLGCSDVPKWDKATEGRNRWIYEECCKGTPYSTIIRRLNKKPMSWERITSVGGIKKAAIAYATRHGKPRPAQRIAGRARKR